MGFIGISNLAVLGGIYLTVALVWWILQIVANWKIFTKAGQAGWKSIIPIYGDYVSYKIAWQSSYFLLLFVLQIVISCIDGLANPNQDNVVLLAIVALLKVITTIISILYAVKLAKAFGKGGWFAAGLIVLSPIFLLILGFGDSQYLGADQ